MSGFRLFAKPPDQAEATDCRAHRCLEHAQHDAQFNTTGPQGSECAMCVAAAAVEILVAENIVPLVLAYTRAKGQLALAAGPNQPELRVLDQLLAALAQKAADDDFKVGSQVILEGNVPEPKGTM